MARLVSAMKQIKLRDILAPVIFLILLIPSLVFRMINKIKGRKLWLIAEQGEARDNGYHFYKYVRTNHPLDYCFYAIKKESAGYEKVSKLGNAIKWGSLKHWLYYMSANLNISSQKSGNPCPIFWYVMHVTFGLYKNRVFLQHGVIKDNLKFAYKKFCKFKYFVCGTRTEYEYILKNFGYNKDELLLTGLPRWDNLKNDNCHQKGKSILIMPTWRKWLGGESDAAFGIKKFNETDYYKHWNNLINNDDFIKYIEDNDIIVYFYPHINMIKYLGFFKSKSKRVKIISIDEDIQEFFKKCNIMITDYTSAAFDFAFLKKPVIYYQFDYSEYRENQHEEGYFKYKNDGFGPVIKKEEDILRAIKSLFREGYKKYLSRMDIFPDQDSSCSERVYDAICTRNRKKVLHVVYSLNNGGTEKYLVNLVKGTRNEYDNYVLFYSGENYWEETLNKLGIKVYKETGGNIKRMNTIRRIINENNIGIVYSYTFYNSMYVLLAAILSGVKSRIVHSHRSEANRKVSGIKTIFARSIITILATNRLACNKTAGEALFVRNKFTIISNGINTEQFLYNTRFRNRIREELKVGNNCMLLGTVGRLDENKNQVFMLQIIRKLKEDGKKCKLAIIGDGEKREYLEKIAKEYSMEKEVLFLGCVRDVERYYNAFDVFLLTSHKEGLPFVLVEAQANGLPIFASSTISTETKINSNMVFLDLKDGAEKWAEVITKEENARMKPSKAIMKYSIDETVRQIRSIYES